MSRRRILPVLVVLLGACMFGSIRPALAATTKPIHEPTARDVIKTYITAFNSHDEKALRAAVADTAKYIGEGGTPRLLIDQNMEAWKQPASAGSVYGLGKRNGKTVVIVWVRPTLADGTTGPWTKGAYLTVQVKDLRIARAIGVILLNDRKMQKKVIGTPPK